MKRRDAMKIIQIDDLAAANEMIRYFNFFHDACIVKIEFDKGREFEKSTGDIVFSDSKSEVNCCNIDISLLHNNYEKSEIEQNGSFDYSFIYEINCFEHNGELHWHFLYSDTAEPFLAIMAPQLIVLE